MVINPCWKSQKVASRAFWKLTIDRPTRRFRNGCNHAAQVASAWNWQKLLFPTLRCLQTQKQQERKLKHVALIFEIVACTVDSFPITSLSPVRLCNLHPLPLCTSKSYGKPPPESKKRILATNAMSQVDAADQRGRKSLLIADGAKCYAPLGRMFKMMVRQRNHSKGNFSLKRKIRGRGWV